MDFDDLRQKLSNITLQGRNLGDVEKASLTLLSEFDFSKCGIEVDDKEGVQTALAKLQQMYQDMYRAAESNPAKPMKCDKEGNAIIEPGTPFHRAAQKIDALKNISIGGILASEWFGELESEREGCFCSFLNTTNDPSETENCMMKIHNKKMGLSLQHFGDCVIYFDKGNQIMQELMAMDFFEYEHLKNTSPEKIPEIYSEEILELFENLISPLSICGRSMHDYPDSEASCWKAIPGGIPPQLINGICINSKNFEMNANVELLMEIFPNVTIFDESKKVLNRNRENEELIKLDEANLEDKLQGMTLGEVSSVKGTMGKKLGEAKNLLELARAASKAKAMKERDEKDDKGR